MVQRVYEIKIDKVFVVFCDSDSFSVFTTSAVGNISKRIALACCTNSYYVHDCNTKNPFLSHSADVLVGYDVIQGPSIKTGQETPDLFADFRFMLWTPAPPCGKEVTLIMFTFP